MLFKCKMCGGALEINNNETVAVCEYCGTKQTLPSTNDEVITNLFNRANNLRFKCEFDKAAQIYEKIVQEDDSQAEAHWGIVLCKYGIEYVQDPQTNKRIPTCHRTLFEAVTTDTDYIAAIDYSDSVQQEIYEQEARAIDKIQRDVLSIVKKEEPFDVFICYKETDTDGKRTVDSVIANDIYHQLTQEGLKVFYAAITLEDKLGQEYEPYIFAALNSAKVMLVVGTKPEYFNAVWVRNEWSRFLKLIKTSSSKLLIPCYRDMDAYDLPEEFAHLQAQDMSKIGFINDIVRGIKKVVKTEETTTTVVKETVVTSEASGNITALLKRGYMALEDGEWGKADDFFEQCLNQNAELAEAYLGKLMSEFQVRSKEKLKDCEKSFEENNNYQKVLRFCDDNLKTFVLDAVEFISKRNEQTAIEKEYADACFLYNKALESPNYICESEYKKALESFKMISGYKDADFLAKECCEKMEEARKENVYNIASRQLSDNFYWYGKNTDIAAYEEALAQFQSLNGWKDSEEKILICKKKIEDIKIQLEEDRIAQENKRLEQERQAKINKEMQEAQKKKKDTILNVLIITVCVIIAIVIAIDLGIVL